MVEPKENQLVYVDENNNEIVCDILFTYDSEEFGKSYVFFTPEGEDDENAQVGVAAYSPTDESAGQLEPVTTEEEWKMLEEVFNSWMESEDEDEDLEDDAEIEA